MCAPDTCWVEFDTITGDVDAILENARATLISNLGEGDGSQPLNRPNSPRPRREKHTPARFKDFYMDPA
ncbi:hypothetical protein ZOSMA_1G01960 [Zostera marina]|uniref:Uncharacterized protein n=1 Tax=Zostera marina TaxID=29655 RepID=A0A0K9PMC7_ZOSMR|nr:hypothetical protein ZOSMA_1G01960 [Zostera marina]